MKLTLQLRRQHLDYWFRMKWKTQSKRKITRTDVPEKLQQEGIQAVDALEYFKPQYRPPSFKIPEPWAFDEIPLGPGHPMWNERICHIFSSDTFLLEGEPQVQVLTKTLKFDGLPKNLQQYVQKAASIADSENTIQNHIKKTCVWDAYQEKLPKKIDKERPHFNFKRSYGIPVERQMSLLTQLLLKQAESHCGKYEGALNRAVIQDAVASVPIIKDGDLLQFSTTVPLLLSSEAPLPEFADSEMVEETKNILLPDIFPIKYTLDLKQEYIYVLEDFLSLRKTSRSPNVHTIFINHMDLEETWNKSQVLARAVGVCYSFAVAQARHHYGPSVNELPSPVCLQCIQSNGQSFDFIAYQLNSIDISGTNGKKNLVWIDPDHKLYEICEEIDGIVHFEGFNSSVFNYFLAFYLNGLNLTSTKRKLHHKMRLKEAIPQETAVI